MIVCDQSKKQFHSCYGRTEPASDAKQTTSVSFLHEKYIFFTLTFLRTPVKLFDYFPLLKPINIKIIKLATDMNKVLRNENIFFTCCV